jgi:hypothetical protein
LELFVDHAVGAAGGAGAIVLLLVGAVVWVVKRVIPAIITQNRTLIDGVLDNMKANTRAVEANTKATEQVASGLTHFVKSQEKRDEFLFKQLDRIERKQE